MSEETLEATSNVLSAEETLHALLASCESAGATFSPKIAFKITEDAGVGVFAKEFISRGELLMSVPYDMCISAAKISEFPTLKPIFQDNPGLLNYPDEVLAIGLMYGMLCVQANDLEKCPWAMHVKTMPTVFNTPLYWNDGEMERLKGHNIYSLTNMLKRQMLQDFNTIHAPIMSNYPEIFDFNSSSNENDNDSTVLLTFEHYVWALSVVYSRALELERRGDIERCVVPVLDMVNHHPYLGINPASLGSTSEGSSATAASTTDANMSVFQLSSALSATSARDTFHYETDKDCMQLLAGRDYGSNFSSLPEEEEHLEEIYAVYGDYSNAKLLYSYGFILPQGLNPFGGVDIYTRLTNSSSFFERKEQLINSIPSLRTLGSRYDFIGTVRKGGFVSEDLLAYVRIVQAQESDMQELENRVRLAHATSTPMGTATIAHGMVSKVNEIKTLNALIELFLLRARVNVAQDEKMRLGQLLLNEDFVSSDREYLALAVQCEDREMLLEAVEKLRVRLAQLEN